VTFTKWYVVGYEPVDLDIPTRLSKKSLSLNFSTISTVISNIQNEHIKEPIDKPNSMLNF
jgi:hypothetical protein